MEVCKLTSVKAVQCELTFCCQSDTRNLGILDLSTIPTVTVQSGIGTAGKNIHSSVFSHHHHIFVGYFVHCFDLCTIKKIRHWHILLLQCAKLQYWLWGRTLDKLRLVVWCFTGCAYCTLQLSEANIQMAYRWKLQLHTCNSELSWQSWPLRGRYTGESIKVTIVPQRQVYVYWIN